MTPHTPRQAELRRAEAATWGPRSRAASGRHRSRQPKLKKWTPHRSGSMLGFASVETPSGMVIHDLRIMTGKNGLWVAMPAQRQLDRDGNPRFDANGRPLYSQIVEFRDRTTANRFGAMVLDLVRREHAGDLDGGAP